MCVRVWVITVRSSNATPSFRLRRCESLFRARCAKFTLAVAVVAAAAEMSGSVRVCVDSAPLDGHASDGDRQNDRARKFIFRYKGVEWCQVLDARAAKTFCSGVCLLRSFVALAVCAQSHTKELYHGSDSPRVVVRARARARHDANLAYPAL